MNEQLPHQDPEQATYTPDGTQEKPDSYEEAERQLILLGGAEISLRGLHAVFTIGAINATRTWRRIQAARAKDEQNPSDNS